jgi:putative membrane protein
MLSSLTSVDRDRIADAVSRAEDRTAGEIVPVVVPQSGAYEVSLWKAASLCALLTLATVLLLLQWYDGWGLGWLYTSWTVATLVLGAGTFGALLGAYVPVVQRLLAGEAACARNVHQRALQAFVEEEVFDTRDRTGILLFVSLLEHRIEVIGDAGINARVRPEDWVDVVGRVQQGIRNDNLTQGLVDAIEMCGRLLERKGVDIRPDDDDELSNRLRTPDA